MNQTKILVEDYQRCFASIQYFKNLAKEYGRLHLSLDDTHTDAFIDSAKLGDRDVKVTWTRTGRYDFWDGGEFFVPVEILCDTNTWSTYIQAEVDAERLKEKQISDAQTARRKLQAIEAAKKLLQDEGVLTPLDATKAP